jgi:hypothetical protein
VQISTLHMKAQVCHIHQVCCNHLSIVDLLCLCIRISWRPSGGHPCFPLLRSNCTTLLLEHCSWNPPAPPRSEYARTRLLLTSTYRASYSSSSTRDLISSNSASTTAPMQHTPCAGSLAHCAVLHASANVFTMQSDNLSDAVARISCTTTLAVLARP